jgi:hypothetical protein
VLVGFMSGVGIGGYGQLVGGGGNCSYENLGLFEGRLGSSGEGRLRFVDCGDIELPETLLGRVSTSTIRWGAPSCRESSCSPGDVAGDVL